MPKSRIEANSLSRLGLGDGGRTLSSETNMDKARTQGRSGLCLTGALHDARSRSDKNPAGGTPRVPVLRGFACSTDSPRYRYLTSTVPEAKPEGLKGITVRTTRTGAYTVAAPATVSGEVLSTMPLAARPGRLTRPSTRKPGDLPSIQQATGRGEPGSVVTPERFTPQSG